MKEMARYGFILALICFVAAGLLSGVNSLTKNKIIAQASAEENASLKDVFPQADNFKEVKSDGSILYYQAMDNNGEVIGAAFKVEAKGYSSTIVTMAGMFLDGKINAIKVLSQNETPGLGSQVSENKFIGQFSGRNIEDIAGVSAVTGATISSRAVINSVDKKAKEVRELLRNAK
jgi:electron transport complex protein RnfG